MGRSPRRSAAATTTGRVSVIIPTFRREDSLGDSIASVLDEDIEDLEVIVIDDSPERSAKVMVSEIDDDRVRYEPMPIPSGGRPALVRNYGIRLASGDVVYFLDDDDEIEHGGLSALASSLQASPSIGVAFGTVTCTGPNEEIRENYQAWFDWAARTAGRVAWSSWLTAGVIMFRGTVIINSCCAIRRSLALELGGYDPNLQVYEDVEFFTRGIRRSGHVFVDRPVLRYRTGMPSIINDLAGDTSPISLSYARMHEKYIERNGKVDYRLLQVVSKALPIGSADQPSADHRNRSD